MSRRVTRWLEFLASLVFWRSPRWPTLDLKVLSIAVHNPFEIVQGSKVFMISYINLNRINNTQQKIARHIRIPPIFFIFWVFCRSVLWRSRSRSWISWTSVAARTISTYCSYEMDSPGSLTAWMEATLALRSGGRGCERSWRHMGHFTTATEWT